MRKTMGVCLLLLLFCISPSLHAQSPPDYAIKLKSTQISPDKILNLEDATPDLLASCAYKGDYYVILQFNQLPDDATKKKLAARGVELMGYLPHYAWQARVKNTLTPADLAGMNLRGWIPLTGNMKLSRALAMRDYPDYALNGQNQIDLLVRPYEGISLEELQAALRQAKIDVLNEYEAQHAVPVRVHLAAIETLAQLPAISYVETVEAPAIPEGLRGRTLHRANLLSGEPGTGYDGTGVVMGIADDGGINHIDFQGRYTDFNSSAGGTHGDMVSGIACGAGNLSPRHIGMATGAYLNMYSISGYPHVVNAIANLASLGTTVTSTSYSQGCGGVYDGTAVNLDADVFTENSLLHVFSAGNSSSSTCSGVYGALVAPDGRYYGNITGGRKAAKSSIATANMEFDDDRTASSSRGPCEDGRLKPDISANGTGQLSTGPDNGYLTGGGTSAASPGIAGVSAMLYQAYKANNGGINPPSSLIKAALLNTADDLGRPGPDYDFGWGRVNARRAVHVIENATYINSSISNGGTNNHTVTVPAGTRQLKIMVYWLDPAGSSTAAQALVNDLNMQVTAPGGPTYNPWILSTFPSIDSIQNNAWRGVDNLNNMEQVTLETPAAGNYTVSVNGFMVPSGPQNYHVVYHFVTDDLTVTYPNGGDEFDPGQSEVIRWDAYGNSGTFDIAYSIDNGSTWTNIITGYSAAERFYTWTPPAGATKDALVRVTRGAQSDVSDANFTIIDVPSGLSMSSTGAGTAAISWSAVTGADFYDIFALGTNYMEYVGSTNGLSFTISGLSNGETNWYSVRAAINNGGRGRRANAIEFTHVDVSGCPGALITSFPYTEGFETGLGDWSQSTTDDIDWTRQTGGTSSSATGPSGAHGGSYYLYTEASGFTNSNAVLTGPCFDLNGLTSPRLVFWYHMYGATMGSLAAEISTDGGATFSTIWSLSGDQGDAWRLAAVDLSAYIGSIVQIRFSGTTGTSFTSDISIDDIAITEQNVCTSSLSAFPYQEGFEGSFGGWEQETGDDFNWSVQTGSTSSLNTGPSAAFEGSYYIYTESSSPNFPAKNANLLSPCFDLTGLVNPELKFNWHMYGAAMGTLDIEVSTDGGITWLGTLWSETGDQGDVWNAETINISSFGGTSVRFRLVATTGTSFTSDMCIDNWRIEDNFTCTSTVSAFPYSEGFETGLGVWSQGITDDIDWTRQTGATSSSSTGPTAADEGSYYLYTEASSPNFPGKSALLYGACFNLASLSNPEFTFRYHMYGADMGTLSLEASVDDGATWSTEWSLSGDQGDAWRTAVVDLSGYAGTTVWLRFSGLTGANFTSDMAIDDLRLQQGVCAGSVSSFPYTETFDGMTLCGNTLFACVTDGSCALSSGWTNESGDNIDWSVDDLNSPSSTTGPTEDHTSGTGNYLFTEASACYGNVANAASPCIDLRTLANPELVFWYHMYGAATGTLSVSISTDGGATFSGPIWTLSGDQGNAWNKATVSLAAYGGGTAIFRFSGTTGTAFTSDIAIDDVGVGESGFAKTLPQPEVVRLDHFRNLLLYPNPARDQVTLRTEGFTGPVTWKVMDLFGRVILESGAAQPAPEEMHIDLNRVPNGYYLLEVVDEAGPVVKRFAVQK